MIKNKKKSLEISVVICTYNSEETISLSIKSILNQTLSFRELIVIDDNSQDNTLNIITKISNKEKRLKVKSNSKNEGIAYCRQLGLEIAKGQLISFLDSDDIADKKMLESQFNLIKKDKKIIGVGCYSYYCDKNYNILGIQKIGPTSKKEFLEIYKKNKLTFILPTTMFRKELALSVGGYKKYVDNKNIELTNIAMIEVKMDFISLLFLDHYSNTEKQKIL